MDDVNSSFTSHSPHDLVQETLRAQGPGGGQQCWGADRSVCVCVQCEHRDSYSVVLFQSWTVWQPAWVTERLGSLDVPQPVRACCEQWLGRGIRYMAEWENLPLSSESPEVSSSFPWQGGYCQPPHFLIPTSGKIVWNQPTSPFLLPSTKLEDQKGYPTFLEVWDQQI